MKQKTFIIWSIEHGAWWAPNKRGYDKERRNAGTYSFEDALKIVKSANIGLHNVPNEAMIEYVEPEKVEVIILPCMECGQPLSIKANGVEMTNGLNIFCHDKDCEDRYAFKQ